MVLIIEDGKVNNGHIVLSKPISLPEGTDYSHYFTSDLSTDGIVLPDALIAATAIEHNLTLYTRNTRHFRRIPE